LWRHDRPITALAASPNGKQLVAGSGDGALRLWPHAERGDFKQIRAHDDEIAAMAFTPDQRFFATAGADLSIKVWDANLRPIRAMKGHERVIRSIAFSQDLKLLASADDQTILIWDPETGRILQRLSAPCGSFRSVAFSGGSRILLSAGNSLHSPSEVRSWQHPFAIGRIVLRHTRSLTALAVSPNAATLAIADDRGSVRLWPN
jgi:WD40 repeat protein